MEIYAIPGYEGSMRRRSLTILLMFFTLCADVWAASRVPFFLILPDNANIADFSDRLMAKGAVVRLSMPPNVLTFDAESNFDLSHIGPVKRVYRSAVPLKELDAYGPLATAAGIQWNRQLLKQASAQGFKTSSAMRIQAAQSSLPKPANLQVIVDGNRVKAAWDGLSGAGSYQTQISKTFDFIEPLESVTSKPMIDLPRLESSENTLLYVRVRGMDGDLSGIWSDPGSVSAGAFTVTSALPAPMPSSPLDGSVSDGFTIILEWSADSAATYRLQLSEKNSSVPLVDQMVQGGEFSPPPAVLKIDKNYEWRVRLWNESGSAWSDKRHFKVGEPVNLSHDALINPEAPK